MLVTWLAAATAALAAGFWVLVSMLWLSSRNEHGFGPQNAGERRAKFASWLDLVPLPQRLFVRFSPVGDSLLQYAGVEWSQKHFFALQWLFFCILAAVASLVGIFRRDLMGIFLGSLLVAAGVVGPTLWLRRRAEARMMEVERALPDFIDRLVLGLEAGLGLEPVLRRTASNFPGLLGHELEVLIHQIDMGHSRSDALQRLAARNPSPQVSAFVTAMRQSDRLGTSLAGVLRVQSALLRSSRRRLAQEAGRRLPILIVFPLVFFLLPALLIVYLAPPLLHLLLGR
jgi:pilus assembly protein TadC